MEEHKLVAERERAHLAQQIVDNPLWDETKKMITDTLIETWQSTVPKQIEEREQIWNMLHAANTVFEQIETVIVTGSLAERQLEKENQNGRSTT